jgi:hypothetical protein
MGMTLYYLVGCTNVSGEEPKLKTDLTYDYETSNPLRQTINPKYDEDDDFKTYSYGGRVCR